MLELKWVQRVRMGEEYTPSQKIIDNIMNSTTISGIKMKEFNFLNYETAKIQLADGNVLVASYDDRVYINFEKDGEHIQLGNEYLLKLEDPAMFGTENSSRCIIC